MDLNKASMRKESFSLQGCSRGVGAWMQKEKCDASWVVCAKARRRTSKGVWREAGKSWNHIQLQVWRYRLMIDIRFLLLFSFYLVISCSFPCCCSLSTYSSAALFFPPSFPPSLCPSSCPSLCPSLYPLWQRMECLFPLS